MQINREKLLTEAISMRNESKIILITGTHRSGKSTFLGQIARELRSVRPPLRIIQASGSDRIRTGADLLGEVRSLGVGPSALLIDDADRIEGLIEAASQIIRKYETVIYLTGRRTKRLETAGRKAFSPYFAAVRLYPAGYLDYLNALELQDSRAHFESFLKTGGLPDWMNLPLSLPGRDVYLESLGNSFLLTEVLEARGIRNPAHVRMLLETLARSAGEPLPAREIALALAARMATISPQSVLEYLKACEEEGLIESLPVWDITRKKLLDTASAWYFTDCGLRFPYADAAAKNEADKASQTAVYNHLTREGWTVYQGRVDLSRQIKETIQFVCERGGKRLYIQMTGSSEGEAERIRKQKALLAARDAWPKYIIGAENEGVSPEGIGRIRVRTFLAAEPGDALLTERSAK